MKSAQRGLSRKVKFIVSLVRPDEATIAETQAYICDAIASWKGSYRPPGSINDNDPGDPMFSLNEDTIKVTRYAPHRR